MKFPQKITLSLLLCIVLNSAALAQVVDIPDPKLRNAIRETLNLPDGASITQADMRQLTELDAPGSQITNLTGLEYATNLAFLSLGDNNIADLTPLAELTQLERLWLWGNPLSDLSPLANLTELKHLVLKHCQISDISALANLTQLTGLSLTNNRIVDVRPLANLTMLRELEIDFNHTIDHSPLDTLSLTHFLYDQSCELPPLPFSRDWKIDLFLLFSLLGAEKGGALYSISPIFRVLSKCRNTIYIFVV